MRLLDILAVATVVIVYHSSGAEPFPTQPESACLPDRHWPVGERLTYRLYWGYVPVGTAVASTEWTQLDGRRLLAIRIRTQSNRVIEKLYPVNDIIESLVDPDSFLPLRFTKNLSEGTHRRNEVTVFDHTNHVAHWTSLLSGRQKTFPVPPGIQDVPTLMYTLRSHSFTPGTKPAFKVMADEKVYDVNVTVLRKETVNLPNHGDVRSIKTEPDAAFEGIFVRKGRLWIWISDDIRRLATKIEASIPVANVKAVLWSVEGPGKDRWATASAPPASADTPGASP